MQAKHKIKLLEKKIDALNRRLANCDICPRNCQVNRLEDEQGYCKTGKDLIIYTHFLHKGEEPPVSVGKGSGTIFFSGCNLKCAYCQNYKFSHQLKGKKTNEEELAGYMLDLQKEGASNINLVTPTHFLPQILKALSISFRDGLNIPIVYNTSGYEKKEIIKQLEGIVDIYLTDLKYLEPSLSAKHCKAPDYPEFAKEAIKEMHRQAKQLLKESLIVRHLVLPNHIQESKQVLSWIKKNLPKGLLSLMFQFRPYFRANTLEDINRPLDTAEYQEIKKFCEELDIQGWVQDLQTQEDMAGVYFEPDVEK